VLLSSHILQEVERLCDKVAIIRSGRIVETGTLTQLRENNADTLEQIFMKHYDSGGE